MAGRLASSPLELVAKGERGYLHDTVLPIAEQRMPLGAVALEPLLATADTPDTTIIELVHPPTGLARLALEYALGGDDSVAIAAGIAAPHELRSLSESYGLTFQGATFSPPNTLTTTIDSKTMAAPGMHVDNIDALPYGVRLAQSRRRLGINLGPGPRYLLVGLPDIMTISAEQGFESHHVPGTLGFHMYARAHAAETSALWMQILPGEAYIAPTELLAHDGSTYGIGQPSYVGFWLGQLPRGTFQAVA
jgi:hypothetical protein